MSRDGCYRGPRKIADKLKLIGSYKEEALGRDRGSLELE